MWQPAEDGKLTRDKIVDGMWAAYAQARFELPNSVPTELERKGMEAALGAIGNTYPYQEGNVIVLGPEIFASADGDVICWRGVNYVRQPA